MVMSARASVSGRNKTSECRKSEVSEARFRLIESMQRINFGRIEGLRISGGEPVLRSPTKVVSTRKLRGENGSRPELSAPDFPLKQEVVELFRMFDELQDGQIDLIGIQYGLPVVVEFAGVLA